MKINIAICDDEHQQTEYVKMLVNKWADENNFKINIAMFDSAENFKTVLTDGKMYDILLLDIQMGGQSGVELARELRLTNDKLIIVFITALSDFVQEGYDVSALHYLIKPINTDKFYSVLDKAVKNLTKNNNAIFLSADDGDIRVLIDNIIYIESFDHFLEVVTVPEKLTVKMPMYELEKQIGSSFIRCHRCYIVNLKYIKKITRTEIILDSNTTLPLSRRLYADVNRVMIKYFAEGKR
jgi:DNA-binding LytR/AlgR family response regulator